MHWRWHWRWRWLRLPTADATTSAGPLLLNLLLVFVGVSGLFYFTFSRLAYYQWDWEAVFKYREPFLRGWLMTIAISAMALVVSLLIGLVAALAQRSRWLALRYAARLYVEVARGTPLLVQIFVLFYCVFEAFKLRQPVVAGVIILSLFSGAYIAEMIRAGIESVGKSQRESARAVGFTTWQTYRHVIFPQALRQTLPPLAGQFASLVKDSSLLSIIAINEFTQSARDISSNTLSTFEIYLPLALGYFILTFPISLYARSMERRFKYET